jgi:hypothetical protein
MVDFKLQYFAVFITPNECPSNIQTSKTTQVFVLSTWYDHNMHRQNIIGWLEVWLLPTDTYNDRVCMMAIFTTGISDWSFYAHLQNCEKQLLALSFNWINLQDAVTSQVYYLSFRYSSTCFGASSYPSSGATTTAVAASGLPSELGDSSAAGRGRADRPNYNQQHCYHQAPAVNQRLFLQL